MKIPIYERHEYDEKFPVIFHYDSIAKNEYSPYFPQWHGAIEFLYIKSSTANLSLNGEKYCVSPGEIVAINSDVVHNISTDDELCRYYCLIVDKNFIEKSAFPINTENIQTIISDKDVAAIFDDIINSMESQLPFKHQQTLGHIYILLSKLYTGFSYSFKKSKKTISKDKISTIKSAVTYIRENFQTDLTLDSIASHCHMSKYYFCRTFSEVTGMTAVKFINSVRCEHAKTLLNAGEYSVSEISGICGFESASYFTKIFKSFYGVTPNFYKNSDRG